MSSGEDGGVAWDTIAARLAPPRNYWLCTVDQTGAPHAAPVWGAVVSGSLFSFSTRSTRKARNLAHDNRAIVHLEGGDDVVIVHGRMEDVGNPSQWPHVVQALIAKYDRPGDAAYLPSLQPEEGLVLYRLAPERAFLWTLSDFDGSHVRWRREG